MMMMMMMMMMMIMIMIIMVALKLEGMSWSGVQKFLMPLCFICPVLILTLSLSLTLTLWSGQSHKTWSAERAALTATWNFYCTLKQRPTIFIWQAISVCKKLFIQ